MKRAEEEEEEKEKYKETKVREKIRKQNYCFLVCMHVLFIEASLHESTLLPDGLCLKGI
jgi:hypothetical protein